MSAKERIRATLDDRGVEWWPLDGTPDMTVCIVDGVRHKYRPVGKGIIWSSCTEVSATPEQAIAATLGAGTCHDVGRYCFTCSECGHRASEPHHMFNRNDPNVMPNFCPNCGRKVEDA